MCNKLAFLNIDCFIGKGYLFCVYAGSAFFYDTDALSFSYIVGMIAFCPTREHRGTYRCVTLI